MSITEHAQEFMNVILNRIFCENWKGGKLTSELTQCRIQRADRGAYNTLEMFTYFGKMWTSNGYGIGVSSQSYLV